MASEGAAPAADVNDGAAQQAQAVTAPPALTGRLSGAPSVVLGVISAAKGALRLAPVVMDSGLSMAQSGTDTLTYYSRRGVELGTGAVRTGITTAGEAAAAHFEARAALAEDESTATSWQRWANNTKRSTSLIDRGINYGSDIVESHVRKDKRWRVEQRHHFAFVFAHWFALVAVLFVSVRSLAPFTRWRKAVCRSPATA
jgi:hypothetical protein